MEQEIQKEPYEKAILTTEGKLRDITAIETKFTTE